MNVDAGRLNSKSESSCRDFFSIFTREISILSSKGIMAKNREIWVRLRVIRLELMLFTIKSTRSGSEWFGPKQLGGEGGFPIPRIADRLPALPSAVRAIQANQTSRNFSEGPLICSFSSPTFQCNPDSDRSGYVGIGDMHQVRVHLSMFWLGTPPLALIHCGRTCSHSKRGQTWPKDDCRIDRREESGEPGAP